MLRLNSISLPVLHNDYSLQYVIDLGSYNINTIPIEYLRNKTTHATPMAIIIPPLQEGQRIEEWEPLFRAAVATLVTAEGGEKAAVRMLPVHVARREAEHSIAAVAFEKNTLDEAFKLLRDNLDPVIDEFEAVRRCYDMHWRVANALMIFLQG